MKIKDDLELEEPSSFRASGSLQSPPLPTALCSALPSFTQLTRHLDTSEFAIPFSDFSATRWRGMHDFLLKQTTALKSLFW